MRLLVLCLAWLAHATAYSLRDQLDNVMIRTDLDAELDKIAQDYLKSLSMAHLKTQPRKKRDISGLGSVLVDETGVNRLQSIEPVSQLCHLAIYSEFLSVGNTTYAICVSQETDINPAEVHLGKYEDHAWKSEYHWAVGNPKGLAAFTYNGKIYVLVADNDNEKGVNLMEIDIVMDRRYIVYTVNGKYPTSISIWKMKFDGQFHLAVANSAGQKDADLTSEVFVFKWFETYYDRYATFQAFDVKDLEPFHIHDAAYLAVANYRRDRNNFQVDSEILKYNLDKKAWISHQKIRTHGARDWEFFAQGKGTSKEFFLAVANEGYQGERDVKSMIYKFVKEKFVPFQCLPTYSATYIASLSDGSTFLLAVAGYDGIDFYQYDGWQFIVNLEYSQGSASSGLNHLVFRNVVNEYMQTFILSVSNPLVNDLSIYEVGFQHENSLKAWNEESTDWCFNVLSSLEASDTSSINKLFEGVIYTDQESPIVLSGDVYFDGGFSTGKLQTPHLKEIVSQEVYDSKMLLELEKLQGRLLAVNEKLNNFEEVLKNALRIDGDQAVYGNLEFQDVTLECETNPCQFDNIQTSILNGEEIGDWSKYLIFLDKPQEIKGTLFADHIVAPEVTVHGKIDGVESHKLVTKSGTHNITGYKTFVNPLTAENLEVHGLVNGIEISPSNILLTTGNQVITGHLTFKEINTTWLNVNGLVNGISLQDFFNDAVRVDQPATITGQKTFHNIVVDNLVINPGSTINGIDLVDLWQNTLWIDGTQEIKAPITFESMIILKNLNVPSGINGIQIPGPRVVDINSPATVTAPKYFEKSTKMSRLNVLKYFNGYKTLEVAGQLPKLDIMLKAGNQLVTGRKRFHNIHLDADSFVYGTVNGVDLSELKAMTLQRDSQINLNSTWTFNNLVINGPLKVNSISGYDIDDIYNRALKLTDTELPKITFKNIVSIEELETRDINGIDIENDLVVRNKEQALSGTKVFEHIILEENSIVLNTINNYNVSLISDTILRIGNQMVKSKTFNRNIKVKEMTVLGRINNVPISDIVSITDDEVLLESREMENVTFNEIEVNNLRVTGTVNNIDVEAMMRDTLTYGGTEEITGTKTITGTIHVSDEEEFSVGSINGINVNELWEDAVFVDVPQTISGHKTFENSVTFDNLVFKSTIDGVSESDMKNWMMKDEPQVIEGNVVFEQGFTAKNIFVTGNVNGINITELDSSIVKVDEPNVIEGTVVFDSVLSNGPVTLSGKIQGVDLSEEIVEQSDDILITGEKNFVKDLVVEGDATVYGLVDGVSVEELCQKAFLVNREQNITRLIIKGDVEFGAGGTIEGLLSGISLKELQEMAVTIGGSEKELTFTGTKTFEDLVIEGPVIIEGTLGGVNLEYLNQTYLSLSRDQEISSHMTFDSVTFENNLSARTVNIGNGKINDVEVDVLNRIMRTDIPQSITAEHYFNQVIFANNVKVRGKINDLTVPDDLMRHNHTNYIRTLKTFEKPVHVLGNLDIAEGKTIQGVDVSEWARKAVLTEGGPFVIDGYKTFHNLSLTDVKVEGLLDGLKISEDSLLMTYGDQVVTGKKTILGDVEIKKSLEVDGLINGENLTNLATNTLQRGRINTVTGTKQFTQPLTIDFLEAPTVAGVDVTMLKAKIDRDLDFGYIQKRLDETGDVIKKMQEAASKQAVVFQYYELFQEFDIPTAYNLYYLHGRDVGELLLLSDNSSAQAHCTSLRLFTYNLEKNDFEAHPQELIASYAISVKSLFVWDTTYLFVANQNPSSCFHGIGEGNVTGDIFIWHTSVFETFQTIETSPIMDIAVFEDGALACVLFVEIRHSNLYCSKGRGLAFEFIEQLPTLGGRKASIVNHNGRIILAIGTVNLSPRKNYDEDVKPIVVYNWDSKESTFGSPVQIIPATYTKSVLLMSHEDEYSSNVFLVIAEGRIPNIRNEPRIVLYRLDALGLFKKYQEISNYGELEWIVLQTGELILFALDSYLGKVELYQYKGVSGFVNIDSVYSVGSTSIHAFTRPGEDSMNHYLALAGPQHPAHSFQGRDYAKILKSKMKGNRPYINL